VKTLRVFSGLANRDVKRKDEKRRIAQLRGGADLMPDSLEAEQTKLEGSDSDK